MDKRSPQEVILQKIRQKNERLCVTDDYDEAMGITETIKTLCEMLLEMAGVNSSEARRELEAIVSSRPREVIAGAPDLPYDTFEKTIQAL